MPTPSFVDAASGYADAGGAWTFTCQSSGAAGRVFIVQILQDGATDNAVAVTGQSNINNLAGSAGWTKIQGPNGDGSFPVGTSGEARQFLYIGRATGVTPPAISGTNSTSEDLFIRSYQFKDVNPGTTLFDVIENFPTVPAIEQTIGANHNDFGRNSPYAELLAQSFTGFGWISGVSLKLGRVGSDPGDSAIIEIRTNAAGVPSDTVLGSASIRWSDLPTTPADIDFHIPLDLASGTLYWIVVRRSGSLSSVSQYVWDYDSTGGSHYSGGAAGERIAGGSWSVYVNEDRVFKVYGFLNNSVGTSNTAADAAVKTVGPDRLALNFVAVNDDNAISEFTGETGGDWKFAIPSYADSAGTDGAIGLMSAHSALAEYNHPSGASVRLYGTTGTEEIHAQSFQCLAGTVSSLWIYGYKEGSPTDDLILEIQTDNAGVPSGTVVGSSGSISGALLGTTSAWIQVQASVGTLSASTTYWLVARRSGARDTVNFYRWETDSIGLYAGGVQKTRGSGTWSAASGVDLSFAIGADKTTIDGGTGSIVDIDAWGVAGFALKPEAPSGPQTYYGITATVLTFTKAVSGTKQTFGQIAAPFTFTKAVAGVRKMFGQVAAVFTLGKDVSGQRKTFGQTATALTFTKAVSGVRKTFGQVAEVFTFGKDVAGRKETFGQTATTLTFTKAVAGVRKAFGQVAAVFTFSKSAAGQRTAFGQTATVITFTKIVAATRTTFAQTSSSFTVGIYAAGNRVATTLYGIVTAPFSFNAVIIGQRKTFGQTAASLVFGESVAGFKTTFAQISQSITVGIVTSGIRLANTFYGAVSSLFTFGKDTSGQRTTFSQISSPFVIGITTTGIRLINTFYGIVSSSFTFGKDISGQRTTFSQITFSITNTITTAGYRVGNTLYGIVAAPFTFSKSVSGQRTTFGQVVIPINFVKNVIGKAGIFGRILFPVTFTQSTNGQRITFGSFVRPFTFVKDVVGHLTTFGSIVRPFTFSKDVAGKKTTFGQTTIPVVFTKDVSAVRTTFSQIATPFTFTKEVLARKTTFARIDTPVIFLKEVAGRKQTFGQVAFPIDLAFAVTAEVQGIRYGRTEMSLVFGEQVAAQRKTFSQLTSSYLFAPAVQGSRTTFGRFDRPFVFSKSVIGQRKTFGQLAFPINANVVVNGRRMAFGSLAMGLIFGKQTAGQRKAFGQSSSSYLLAAITQATRETFGEVDTTIDFIVDVETGRVDAFSALAFEILIGLESAGFVRPKGVILNLAKEIYLGATFVDSVYTDGQKVWPPEI